MNADTQQNKNEIKVLLDHAEEAREKEYWTYNWRKTDAGKWYWKLDPKYWYWTLKIRTDTELKLICNWRLKRQILWFSRCLYWTKVIPNLSDWIDTGLIADTDVNNLDPKIQNFSYGYVKN